MTTAREHAVSIRSRLARHRERRIGTIKRKILLLLLGGFTMGLSGSPATVWKIIGALRKEWKENPPRPQKSNTSSEEDPPSQLQYFFGVKPTYVDLQIVRCIQGMADEYF